MQKTEQNTDQTEKMSKTEKKLKRPKGHETENKLKTPADAVTLPPQIN